MNSGFRTLTVVALAVLASGVVAHEEALPRSPAVPLVAVDPYFSVWSAADRLTDADRNGHPSIVHWTGVPNQLTSLVRVDGNPYRIMGVEPRDVPAMTQTELSVLPTTVAYSFEASGVRIGLSFMTPLLPDDLMVFARPVTCLTWQADSIDGKEHAVQIYYDNAAELVVNNARTEKVAWSQEKFGAVTAMRVGSTEQAVLRTKGDRVRINWGYEYVAIPDSQAGKPMIAPPDAARDKIRANGPWAPLPALPRVVEIIKPGTTVWRYTTKQPAEGWLRPDFDDASWSQAPGGFGTRGTPNADVKTVWDTSDIWLRADTTIPEGNYNELQLNIHHDEDAEVYISSQQAARLSGYTTEYELVPIGTRAVLKPGRNLFAIHCHQTQGGQYIDLGIVDIRPVK